jgi:hypothetical protein
LRKEQRLGHFSLFVARIFPDHGSVVMQQRFARFVEAELIPTTQFVQVKIA